MEKTISARTSTTVSGVNIDSYICDLDNDISITNDHSYLGESLELSKVDVAVSETADGSIVCENDKTNDTSVNERSIPHDSLKLHQDTVSDTRKDVDQVDINQSQKSSEEDPFLEKKESQEHEFVINSPFSKPSKDFVDEFSQGIRQPMFGDSVSESKSAKIVEFKGLKAGKHKLIHT